MLDNDEHQCVAVKVAALRGEAEPCCFLWRNTKLWVAATIGGVEAVLLELPPRMEGSFWVVVSGGATGARKFSGTVYMVEFFFVGCMEKFKLPHLLGPFLLNLAFT